MGFQQPLLQPSALSPEIDEKSLDSPSANWLAPNASWNAQTCLPPRKAISNKVRRYKSPYIRWDCPSELHNDGGFETIDSTAFQDSNCANICVFFTTKAAASLFSQWTLVY
jgi:hypothetical protein